MFLKGTHRAAGNGQEGRFPPSLFVRTTQTCGGEPRHQWCVQAKALGQAAAEGLLAWQVWCCVTRATKGCDSCGFGAGHEQSWRVSPPCPWMRKVCGKAP